MKQMEQSTYQGRTYKEVVVTDLRDDDADRDIAFFAMGLVGESPHNLQNWRVERWPATVTATVTLYTH